MTGCIHTHTLVPTRTTGDGGRREGFDTATSTGQCGIEPDAKLKS